MFQQEEGGNSKTRWSSRYDQGRIATRGSFSYARAVRAVAGRIILQPDPQPSTPAGAESTEHRASVRRRLLRANTAVAVMIASTLVLSASALWQSLRATKLQATAVGNQRRAESAEGQARAELWRALLAEARAAPR